MFDFSWGELILIGGVALIVIGPKELPAVLRTFGQYMGKIRRMAADFQGQFQEAMREAELTDLKKEVDSIRDSASGFVSGFNPTAAIEDPTRPAEASDPIPAGPPPPLAESSPEGTVPLPAPAEQPALPPPEAAPSPEVVPPPPAAALPPQAAPPAPAVDLNIPVPEAPPPVTEKDFAAAPTPKAGEGGA